MKAPSKNVSYFELVNPPCLHAVNIRENACGLQPSRAVTFVIRHRHFLFSFLEPAVRIAVPTGVFEVSREMARGEEGGGAYER